MHDMGDQRGPDFEMEPAYPTTVTTAGVIWIVIGGIILLQLLLLPLVILAVAPEGPPAEMLVGGACMGLLMGLFGAAFVYVGVQSVKGTAKDTLGNGIGSIIFGLLVIGNSAAQIRAGDMFQAVVALISAIGLIVAGVLALVGRSEYKAWRRAKKKLPMEY
jgi:hypothetical protein